MVFPVVTNGCGSWTVEKAGLKNWCFPSVVLEKTPAPQEKSPLDRKGIKLVNLKGNQPWILIGRMEAETKLQYFGHLMQTADSKKAPDAEKDWGQKERSEPENEMARWHHQCNGHECGQTSRDSVGQKGLACCSPWGHKESDMTGQLNNNNLDVMSVLKILLDSLCFLDSNTCFFS